MKSQLKNLFSICLCLLILSGITGLASSADKDFPSRAINLYVGWGPGGGTSMQARIISSKATELLNTPVVVKNKPGASASICHDFVRRAKPDGYTLMLTTSADSLTAPLLLGTPYKVADFEYFGMFAGNPMVLVVNSKSPWNTLQDLIKYAKANPGKLKYASGGPSSATRVMMEIFKNEAGVNIVHVPFKSEPEILAAMLGEHCQVAISHLTGIQPVKDSGQLRVLSAVSEKRLKWYPDLPTLAEQGLSTPIYEPFWAVGGPSGMPKEVSAKLKDALEKTFQDKEVTKMLVRLGATPTFMSGEDLTKYLNSQIDKLSVVYKKIGFEVKYKGE
ncbi:tripartite tricarboxylate transporter substrate binding protein [bacterium]|nr:tripartite tricarboxylate transporter substrate binding protein [bacterium]